MKKVFLNSLPKSGTHLIGKLLDYMGFGFSNANFSSSSIYGRNVLAKSLLRAPMFGQAGIEVGLDISTLVKVSWVENKLQSVNHDSFCGGHAPYSDALYTLIVDSGLKPIHIIRDPRDVLLSWVHYVPKTDWHYGAEGLAGLSLEERVRKVLYGYRSGSFLLESFPSILSRASGWLNKDSVLTIRFEDLVGEKGGGSYQKQIQTINEVGCFVGCNNFDEKQIAENLFGGTKVFRKGQVGAYKDELSASLLSEINVCLEKDIVQMGYKV